MITKYCPVCNNKFETKYKSKIYCDRKCKNKAYLKICIICNNEFRTSHKDSKSCSKKCASEITKMKTREEECFACKNKFTRPTNTFASDKKRYFCSTRCANRIYSLENPTRYGGTWKRRRKEVLHRDNYKCTICNSTLNLEVHHFIPVTKFEDPNDSHYDDNVITYCKICHDKEEKNVKI